MKRNNVSKFSIHSLIQRLKGCYPGNSNKINQNWYWFDKVVDPIKHDPTTVYVTGQNKIQVKCF